MKPFARPPTRLVGLAVLAATTACAGASSANEATTTTSPVVSDFTVATTTTSSPPPTAEPEFGALGILTLRPVITCEPRARADDALGEDLLAKLDDEYGCVVGPSSGTGVVFERGSAQAVLNDELGQWVVTVDLRSDGKSVWDAAALPCFERAATCPTGQLAIVLDDVIQSAPVVQTADFPRAVQISGSFDQEQARRLAEILNRVVEPIADGDDAVLPTTLAPTTAPPPPTVATTAPATVEEAPVVDWDGTYRQKTTPGRTVQLGDLSPLVEQLQQALSRLGYPLEADGYFGYGTESAVRQFQRDRGLPVTGIATDDVWDAISQ